MGPRQQNQKGRPLNPFTSYGLHGLGSGRTGLDHPHLYPTHPHNPLNLISKKKNEGVSDASRATIKSPVVVTPFGVSFAPPQATGQGIVSAGKSSSVYPRRCSKVP